MLTFISLVTGLILIAIALDRLILKTRVIFTRHTMQVIGILALITVPFDNVMSALPVYVFNTEKTLGIYLPWSPIEDVFYMAGIVMLVATLDAFFTRYHRQSRN